MDEIDAIERWAVKADAEISRKKAEQDFVNRIIDSFDKMDPFRNCPDHDDLHLIAELAVRLVHSCDKTIGDDGTGVVHGFGIKGKFIKAVREHSRSRDIKEARAEVRLATKRRKEREKRKVARSPA